MMSNAVTFRPMIEADLDAVLKIEYAAFSHPWTRGIFLDGLGKYHIWLMFEGEQQVGHGVVIKPISLRMSCHTSALRCGSSIKSSRPGSAQALETKR